MGKINPKTLNEIQLKAKEYMINAKGENISDEDILIAENLIMFGYLKAKMEYETKEKKSDAAKANEAFNLLTESFN